MTDFTDSCASGEHSHEEAGGEQVGASKRQTDIPKQQVDIPARQTVIPARQAGDPAYQVGGPLPPKRTPHEAEVRSKRPRRTEAHWNLEDEMEPGLLAPQEKWLAEFEQAKRRDRHNLTVLLVLIGYLGVCGLVAAWLLVSGVEQQTVNMFLQVFVVSLVPVIALIARGFHR